LRFLSLSVSLILLLLFRPLSQHSEHPWPIVGLANDPETFLRAFSSSDKPFNTLASIAAVCYLHILYVFFTLLKLLLMIFSATPSILKACKFHIFIQ